MIMHQLGERAQKMLEVLNEFRIREDVPVTDIRISTPKGKEQPFENGGEWGKKPEDNWRNFRFEAKTPDSFRGRTVLRVRTGLEGQWEATHPQFLLSVDGTIMQAFDTQHTEAVLSLKAVPGETHQIFLEGYANTEFQRSQAPHFFASLADVMPDVEGLYYDIKVAYEAARLLENGSRDQELSWRCISDALNLLDLRDPFSSEFHASVGAARAYMKDNYYAPLRGKEPEAIADCVGHTHIDVAWLWDENQTRHKAARSFATMLRLMELYPDFKFMSSQPQLYQYIKEDHPGLFEKIRKAVKEGRWEPEGGMWVEADCNLTGGEALVRQLLYGNEFFNDEFGKTSRVLWLPDVFGYSAALPQILKKSGIDYFMTSKLSWSEFNETPYDTFMWRGIDGSEVLTHFTPARGYVKPGTVPDGEHMPYFTTYNAMLSPSEAKGGWQRFQQKGLDNHFLVSYGYGDGGGGSTDWMLENASRMKNPLPGCPAVRQTFPTEFFTELEKRVKSRRDLPRWSGELYLEYHRGTYTSQGRQKLRNKMMENALREAEAWSAAALVLYGTEYPQDDFRTVWRRTLMMQFHDVLPGSAIRKVYEDCKKDFERIYPETCRIQEKALGILSAPLDGDIVFFNSISQKRDAVAIFTHTGGNISALEMPDGGRIPVQMLYPNEYVVSIPQMPPMGMIACKFVSEYEKQKARCRIDKKGFETPFYRGKFDRNMHFTSLYDKRAGRELVKKGSSLNRIVYYENRPHNYDAWDINIYYDEKAWELGEPESVEIFETGPVFTRIEITWKISKSSVREEIFFFNDTPVINFICRVDWHEPHGLLKVHFPVDIFYDQAQFGIQYGNVTRSVKNNTSWDKARFEVCAHNWADVSEPDYGFAILTEAKYGFSVSEDDFALSLVKSATDPDPEGDQGKHDILFGLLPHLGNWRQANIPGCAYNYSLPVTVYQNKGNIRGKSVDRSAQTAKSWSMISVDKPDIMVESVKGALHGEGIIIRMYENFGCRTEACISLGFHPKTAVLTDLMENDIKEMPVERGDTLILTFKPYEIITIRITF